MSNSLSGGKALDSAITYSFRYLRVVNPLDEQYYKFKLFVVYEMNTKHIHGYKLDRARKIIT